MTGPLPFLPYGRQAIDEADIAAVIAVLGSPYLTTGPTVTAFDAALAARLGAAHALCCNSGTAALHLACLALDLGPGDAAIVPSITFLATANAVRMTGAEVVFADVDPDHGLMTPASLTDALARAATAGLRVRAVLPVHLAGQCADMPALHAIAKKAGIALIEDASHAIGTDHQDQNAISVPVGACRWSDMTIFSFHPVKTMAAGEAGAITTQDPDLAERIASLRNHGMTRDPAHFQNRAMAFDATGTPNPWYYEMGEIGWNYRLSDIHAALGLSQLAKLDRFIAERRALVACYDAAFAELDLPLKPLKRVDRCRPAWHLYPVLIDFDRLSLGRSDLMRRLHAAGIGTQVHYIPVHRQPYYAARYPGLRLVGADEYYRRTLSLPLFIGLDRPSVQRVVKTLAALLGHGLGLCPA